MRRFFFFLLVLGLGGVGLLRADVNVQAAQRGLKQAGFDILNDVVLNQVVAARGNEHEMRRIVQRIQDGGTCWVGPTFWRGRHAMRISVSSWATTAEDVEKSLAAIIAAAGQPR